MELCEWDPKNNKPAYDPVGCENAATVCVGAKGEWHLCDSCAALPVFKRYRKRTPLRDTTPAHPPDNGAGRVPAQQREEMA